MRHCIRKRQVVGAATVSASGAGTGDTVTVQVLNNATEDAKDVSITTNAAVVKTTANTLNFTGNIDVNAPNAIDVNLASATGGATIVAKGDDGTSGTDGIDVAGVDASGVSITTSHVGVATEQLEQQLPKVDSNYWYGGND